LLSILGCPNTSKPGRVTKTQQRGLSNIDARAMQKFDRKIIFKNPTIIIQVWLSRLIYIFDNFTQTNNQKAPVRMAGRGPVNPPFLPSIARGIFVLTSFRVVRKYKIIKNKN
jgi:hypothetical protein